MRSVSFPLCSWELVQELQPHRQVLGPRTPALGRSELQAGFWVGLPLTKGPSHYNKARKPLHPKTIGPFQYQYWDWEYPILGEDQSRGSDAQSYHPTRCLCLAMDSIIWLIFCNWFNFLSFGSRLVGN